MYKLFMRNALVPVRGLGLCSQGIYSLATASLTSVVSENEVQIQIQEGASQICKIAIPIHPM